MHRRTLKVALLGLACAAAGSVALTLHATDAAPGISATHQRHASAPRISATATVPARHRRQPDAHIRHTVHTAAPHQHGGAARVLPKSRQAPTGNVSDLFDPTAPSATAVIPRLGVQATVYERGVDGKGTPEVAPGYGTLTHFHFSGQLGQPGNYVLYGHDDLYGNIFQSLGSMQVGDLVRLTQGAHRYTYRVTGGGIVAPTDVAVMDPTPNATLTLISCTPMWVDTQRIVVRAMLVERDGHKV